MADKAHILEQLRSEKAFYKYDYGNATLDPWLTDELSRLIASVGVADIRNIAFFSGMVPYTDIDGLSTYQQTSFFYDALTGNTIKGIGGRDFDPRLDPDVFAKTANEHFIFTFHGRYSAGLIYFVVSVEAQGTSGGSWLKQIATAIAPILPVVMLVGNIFAPGFASVLGAAILGPIGVTSIALTTLVGNIAISTVASGGDIEGAMKSALLGSLGASIGQAVGGTLGGALDSDVLAKATSAATSAAITGGDPKTAAVGVFIPAGVSIVSDYLYDWTQQPADATMPDDSLSTQITVANSMGDTSNIPDLSMGVGFDTMTIPGSNVDAAIDVGSGIVGVDVPVWTETPDITIAQTSSGATTPSSVLANLTNLALAALKITQAYSSAGSPKIQVSGTTANGTHVIANPNGTVSVNGQVTLPAKGVPYVTPQGTVIVNNGDGTYSTVGSNGVSATNPYPVNSRGQISLASGLTSNNVLLYGGIALALILIARR